MEKRKKNIDSIHYALTFFSIVALIGFFGTHFITGNPALIVMDSLAGSILLGIIFSLYLCWFMYESSLSENLSLPDAVRSTLKSNPVAYCIYAYWIVFIIIPPAINVFL
ncbi:MAG: hypothetical protein L3J69_08705 [Desulfobacula sp.]|nr:hypothetical protein [Desulfobacula sp.]